MKKCLVYDIETIPETVIGLEWQKEEAAKADDDKKKDPLPPTACHKVLTIGAMLLDENLEVIHSGVIDGGCTEGNEHDMVEKWNSVARNEGDPLQLIDWNGKRFDAPVLQFRSFHYGIDMSWYFDKLPDNKGFKSKWSKAYRDRFGGMHLDLCDYWTNSGAFYRCKLPDLAKLMGLPGKTGIDGSMVYDAWKDGRKKEIDDYCLEDVWHTGFVMMRIFLLAGKINKTRYIASVTNLLNHIEDTAGDDHKAFLESVDRKPLLLE